MEHIITELHGRGELLLDDQEVLTGNFEISYDLNRNNGLVVKFQAAGNDAVAFEERMALGEREDLERRLALAGETDDSISVKIDQLLIARRTVSRKSGQPMQLVLVLLPRAPLTVAVPPDGASTFQFLCPNLLFTGLMSTAQEDGGYKMDTVIVETEHDGKGVRFRLKQLPGYEEAAADVQQTTKNRWTATLDVETADGSTIKVEEASSLADDFFLLLSFALSVRVTWVSLKAGNGSKEFQKIRPGTIINLNSFPGSVMGDGTLVAGNNGFARHPLSEFMEVALPGYWSLAKVERNYLREAIERMCESIERFFTPATITLAGRSFESLCRGFLNKGERSYLAGADDASVDLRKSLAAKLTEFGEIWRQKDSESADEWSKLLEGYVASLMRRPFKAQLSTLLNRYLKNTGNPYNPTWKNQFVNARNKAAHDSAIGKEEASAWGKGITLLAQVILKILGYSGPYVNFYGNGAFTSRWSIIH